MKIILVSPDKQFFSEARQFLTAAGHVVQTRTSVRQSPALTDAERIDLILVHWTGEARADPARLAQMVEQRPDTALMLVCEAPDTALLLTAMRAGVREILPTPMRTDDLAAALARLGRGRRADAAPGGRTLAFIGCKGGVGTTFIATNVGHVLAQSHSVLLIDLNLQFGDALSYVYDDEPASTIADLARDLSRLDASFLETSAVRISERFHVLAAPSDPSQAIHVLPEHIAAILAVAKRRYDFVVFDVGRPVDVLALKALDDATVIFPVMQASLPNVRNAKKMLAIFKALGYPDSNVELIVNRFKRGADIGLPEIEGLFPGIAIRTIAGAFREVDEAINHGDVLPQAGAGRAVHRALVELAAQLTQSTASERTLLARLFRRA